VLIFLYDWNHLYRFAVEMFFSVGTDCKGCFSGVLTAFPLHVNYCRYEMELFKSTLLFRSLLSQNLLDTN
jgi:hypothetical protein